MTDPTLTADPDAAETADAGGAPPRGPSAAPPSGFELLDEVGRGGMGVVYRARDRALDREVAVKALREQHAPASGTAVRFIEEARITGQLQHPGIPAVYQVGVLPDGRPFLAMKLIKGRTLDALLRDGAVADPLGVFEAVCQAVGYAHAHKVIHRDLKPANVMVGAFGEVQVMDWGLAKVLTAGAGARSPADPDETAAKTRIQSARDSDTPFTQYGSVMGTPAFMSPEQAAGEIDKVDRRSDVFGLGAILCVLLTGRPPYAGPDADAVRVAAVRGKTDEAFARLDACGGEPEVVALCKRCLAFERDERPADADAVARRIAELRQAAADRARHAEVAQAQAEVQAAEQRKRRRVLAWGGAAIVLVLAVGVAVAALLAVWATGAERETAKQLHETERAKQDTADQLLQTEAARKAAVENQRRADGRTRELLDSYNQMVFGIQTKLETRPGTLELRRELLENARGGLKKILDEARGQGTPDRTFVWSHYRLGDVEMALGNPELARQEYQVGFDLAKTLADADPDGVQPRHDLSFGYDKLANVSLQLGSAADALALYVKGRDIRLALAAARADDLAILRDLGVSHERVGDMNMRLDRVKAAEESYRKGLEVRLRLEKADPGGLLARRDVGASHMNLGDAAIRLGRVKDALDSYEKGNGYLERVALADPLNAQTQDILALCYDRVGDMRLRLRRSPDALATYRKGLEVREARADADRRNVQARTGVFFSYYKLACAYEAAQEYGEAAGWFAKARACLTQFRELGWYTKPEQRLGIWTFGRWTDEIDRYLEATRKADEAVADLEFAFRQPRDVLQLLIEFRTKTLLKRGKMGDAVATVERFARWAEEQGKDRPLQRYNVACGYAVCAAAADEKERVKLAARALDSLRKAKSDGHFHPGTVAHFHQDGDFDGIRDNPDVAAFVTELDAPHETAPTPRPVPEK